MTTSDKDASSTVLATGHELGHGVGDLLGRTRRRLYGATAWLAAWAHSLWARTQGAGDEGEVTEKAAIVAIMLAAALGLGAAIKAAVSHYQQQIH